MTDISIEEQAIAETFFEWYKKHEFDAGNLEFDYIKILHAIARDMAEELKTYPYGSSRRGLTIEEIDHFIPPGKIAERLNLEPLKMPSSFTTRMKSIKTCLLSMHSRGIIKMDLIPNTKEWFYSLTPEFYFRFRERMERIKEADPELP